MNILALGQKGTPNQSLTLKAKLRTILMLIKVKLMLNIIKSKLLSASFALLLSTLRLCVILITP